MSYGSLDNDLQRSLPTELSKLGGYLKMRRPSMYVPTSNQLLKYCGPSIKTGRPLGKVMMILTGEDGHEISNTINCWYDDPKLCPHDKTSEEQIVEYRKNLNVTAESPPLSADWSIIKIPIVSRNSSHPDEEPLNFHKIKSFSSSNCVLSRRIISPDVTLPRISGISVNDVREEVYPNIVILVIKATDVVQAGLKETILKLKASNLVDLLHPNLLVVATQAMSISPVFYNNQIASLTKMVQNTIFEVLGLQDTKVIFVDNNDENRFEKQPGCDFLELPNGELSHQNLMEAIVDTLDKNSDNLGKLLCIWYYKTTCPDSFLPPMVISYDETCPSEITNEMLASAREEIDRWRKPPSLGYSMKKGSIRSFPARPPSKKRSIPPSPPEPLVIVGYGYSPITLDTANGNNYLLSEIDHTELKVNRKRFNVPKCINLMNEEFTNFKCFTIENNRFQEFSHKIEGGWSASASFNLDLSFKSKWNNSSSNSKTEKIVYVKYEPTVGYFQIQNPDTHLITYPDLLRALTSLPEEYSRNTEKDFQRFFDKWGTHIVTKAYLGGSLTISMSLKASSFKKENLAQVEAAVKAHLPFLSNPGVSTLLSTASKTSSCFDISVSDVQMEGGVHPHPLTSDSLNKEVFNAWIESVKAKPSVMKYNMKFLPYHALLTDDSKRRDALEEATTDYCNGHVMKETSKNRGANEMLESLTKNDEMDNQKRCKSCFPPFVSVSLANGTSKKISKLIPLDNLIAIKYSEGIKFQQLTKVNSPFQIYLHKDPEEDVLFLCMKFSNGKVLVASPEHLLFVYDDKCQQLVSKMAEDLKVNRDKMVYFDGNGYMTSPILVEVKGEIHKGIYAPLTSEGTFIADGFLVSCYADVNSFQVPHFALAPLRLWNYCKDVFDFKEKKKAEDKMQIEKVVPEDRIHPYLMCLMQIRNLWNKI